MLVLHYNGDHPRDYPDYKVQMKRKILTIVTFLRGFFESNVLVDETGSPVLDESGNPIRIDV